MNSFLPRGTDTSGRKAQFSQYVCNRTCRCVLLQKLLARIQSDHCLSNKQARGVHVSLLKKLNCFITRPGRFVLVG